MYHGLEKAVACGGLASLLMKLESGSKSEAVIFLSFDLSYDEAFLNIDINCFKS